MHSRNAESQGRLTGDTTLIKIEFNISFGLMLVKDWCGAPAEIRLLATAGQFPLRTEFIKSCVESIITSQIHSFLLDFQC